MLKITILSPPLIKLNFKQSWRLTHAIHASYPNSLKNRTHDSTVHNTPLPQPVQNSTLPSSYSSIFQILFRYHTTQRTQNTTHTSPTQPNPNQNMFRISNTLVGILNILTLLLSLAAMCVSAYIHFHTSDCLKVLQYPLLFGAAFVFVVSILGVIGSLCRSNGALYAYLLVTFFVILAFMLFTVFALFVTNHNVGDKVSGKGFGEHRVADFSRWLQQYVINDKNWDDIKSCLVDAHVCRILNLTVDDDGDHRRNVDSVVFQQFSTTQVSNVVSRFLI